MASILPTSRPIPFSLSDLSQPDINLLTRILSQPPTPALTPTPTSNHNALRTLIRSLPTHLRAPIPHQHTITALFPRSTSLPPAAPLCPLHTPLNAQLIHTILTTLTTELGPRLHALTRPALSPHLTPSQSHLLPRLQALHALWLPPPTYRARFGADPLPQWSFQADACEACMLARVGAQKSALVALRTVLVSRRQKGRRAPRLLRWVDGWMAAVGGQEAEAMRVEGGVDGRVLRGARRRAAAAATRRREGGGLEGGREEEDADEGSEGEGDDFENEIIHLYTGRPSSTDVHLPTDHDEISSSSRQSGRQSGPSSLGSRRRRDQGMGEAETRADEYRALLGSRASSDRPNSERRSGSTTWSAFLRR